MERKRLIILSEILSIRTNLNDVLPGRMSGSSTCHIRVAHPNTCHNGITKFAPQFVCWQKPASDDLHYMPTLISSRSHGLNEFNNNMRVERKSDFGL